MVNITLRQAGGAEAAAGALAEAEAPVAGGAKAGGTLEVAGVAAA